MIRNERPLTIAMLAVGGQGGGVLTKWLVDTAEANGWLAQSTFVAGVAQRTGATVYGVEMFPADRARESGREPVFTPYPIPGDVDIVIAGEMAETGRAIQKGFVTPEVTTLIASSHRIYSIVEKEALGDGIADQSRVAEVAARASKRFICFDMQAAADASGSVISAVLLGAVAGSGALPFERAAFEATIRRSGRAVAANLAGFAAGFDGATADARPRAAEGDDARRLPPAAPAGPAGQALAGRIDAEFPEPVRNLALHGALRTLDYQDAGYADFYLERLAAARDADAAHGGGEHGFALTAEVARQLALQMCYEDPIRVADLKTRRERLERVREQLAAAPGQPLRVIEYFHPRIEEFCDTLPAPLGARLLQSRRLRRLLTPLFSKGRNVQTTSISGFLMLRFLAGLGRFRRSTYRYGRQQALIDDWLARVTGALARDYDYALSIARCIELVRGYGETYRRGLDRYRATIGLLDEVAAARRAEVVRRLQQAALADEEGKLFMEVLAGATKS